MSQQNKRSTALIKTVVYSSLFHFPLTEEEIWKYFIADLPLTKAALKKQLVPLPKELAKKDNFYVLCGEETSVALRQAGEIEYMRKLPIIKKAIMLLSFVPSIMFIGLSGSLALGTAKKDDDIDFFIITSPGAVWSTRLISLVLLSLVGLRRQKGVIVAPNKICLNSFIASNAVGYFTQYQNIYLAHEIAQLCPLFNRDHTYEQFLAQNNWYRSFLPNAHASAPRISVKGSSYSLGRSVLKLADSFLKFLQLLSIKKTITREIVQNDIILFHPHDYNSEIVKKYEAKLSGYDLLTTS